MEKIPMYLNDKEIARKITECVSSATGNDIQEHMYSPTTALRLFTRSMTSLNN